MSVGLWFGLAILAVSWVRLFWRLVGCGGDDCWLGLAILTIGQVWFGLIPVDDLTSLPDSHLSGQTHDGSFPYNELPNLHVSQGGQSANKFRKSQIRKFAYLQNFLKVPKCEIFDRSEFPDFYTIKSRREGDFGVKIKKFKNIFRGPFGAAKFLMRMLSIILRSAFPSKHAEHTHQGLMRTLSIRVRN